MYNSGWEALMIVMRRALLPETVVVALLLLWTPAVSALDTDVSSDGESRVAGAYDSDHDTLKPSDGPGRLEPRTLTRRYRVLLDVSVPEVRAPDVWRIGGLGLNGSGVAIGIIDTGIDYRHPDFYFPNGRTKILAIWDQTLDGDPPENFGYGHECERWEIESGDCPSTDTVGHGTHVASIAAGTGRAGPYVGVAPGAYLLVVKSGYPACGGREWFMEEDKIIDGIRYLAAKAEELGLRLVISLSIGSDLGGHDGSSPLERVLDEVVDRGVIVVAAAGNSADEGRHVMGYLKDGEPTILRWVTPPMARSLAVSLWHDHGDEVNLTLRTPSGMRLEAPVEGRVVEGIVVNLAKKVHETGVEWLLELSSHQDLRESGWSLEILPAKRGGSGKWHAWIGSDTCSPVRERFLPGEGYIVSPDYTVTIPATARKVIAVGGYVTKNAWRNHLGEELRTIHALGELLNFSGRGPTRDGRIKPEVTAPGSVIVAAKPLSGDYSRLDVNEYYTARHGTSMSSPHAAGVVAIILQFMPQASYEDVLSALTSSARWEERMGERPNNSWGWGMLNAKVVFRVEVRIEGLPSNVTAKIAVGDMEVKASAGVPIEKFFLVGRPQTIEVDGEVDAGAGVRYVANPNRLTVRDDANITIVYTPEYRLDVGSDVWGEKLSGWYKPGTTVRIPESPYTFPEDLRILLEPVRRMSGWIDEEGNILEGEIVVDRPRRIWPIYEEDYGVMIAGWIILASSIVLSAASVWRWASSRRLEHK